MIKASEVTFGIEFEVQIPNDYRDAVSIGEYHSGHEQEWLPEGWTVQRDGSLVADSGYFPVEIVSPVLKGESGLEEVVYVLDFLTQLGATVNKTMGMHVHVGGKDLAADKIPVLKRNFAQMEKFLFSTNGDYAGVRYTNHTYCKPSHLWQDWTDETDRYRSLNLVNYFKYRRKKTVEFRLWRPTVDATMAVAAIYASVGLVVNTINKGLIDVGQGTRAEILRKLFSNQEIDRIVDGECWDVLLYMAREQRKSTI